MCVEARARGAAVDIPVTDEVFEPEPTRERFWRD